MYSLSSKCQACSLAEEGGLFEHVTRVLVAKKRDGGVERCLALHLALLACSAAALVPEALRFSRYRCPLALRTTQNVCCDESALPSNACLPQLRLRSGDAASGL